MALVLSNGLAAHCVILLGLSCNCDLRLFYSSDLKNKVEKDGKIIRFPDGPPRLCTEWIVLPE